MLNTTYPMTHGTGTINGEAVPEGWQAQNELAREITANVEAVDGQPWGMDYQAWTTVLSAMRSTLPIVVTVRYSADRVETFTAMVEYAHVNGVNTYIRLRSWGGFSTPYYLGEIVSVATPDRQYH